MQIKLKIKHKLQVKQRRPLPRCSCVFVEDDATQYPAPPEVRFDAFAAIQSACAIDNSIKSQI